MSVYTKLPSIVDRRELTGPIFVVKNVLPTLAATQYRSEALMQMVRPLLSKLTKRNTSIATSSRSLAWRPLGLWWNRTYIMVMLHDRSSGSQSTYTWTTYWKSHSAWISHYFRWVGLMRQYLKHSTRNIHALGCQSFAALRGSTAREHPHAEHWEHVDVGEA